MRPRYRSPLLALTLLDGPFVDRQHVPLMKTASLHNVIEGSTANVHTFVADPVPKTCRHRTRSSFGRCVDCGMHREPAMATGNLPSVALIVKI